MTIYDIAEEAGVSAATVSRVINDRPGIKESTRIKVREILAKYDFSVSAQARGLVNRSSMMIGILISDIRNLHYSEGAYIIERKMLSSGYCSIIMNTGSDPSQMASSIKSLSERRVDGFILIGSAFANALVKEAISKYLGELPFVIENGRLGMPGSAEILADDRKGAFDAASYLIERGKKRIAFINSSSTPSNMLKIEGYKQALGERAIIVDGAEDSYEGGYEATRRLLSEDQDIDGIIYAVDILTLGGVRAALDLGLDIPGRLSLIGFDNSPYSFISNPKLSSIDSRLNELSEKCADVLLRMLKKEEVEKEIVFPPLLVLRETT